MSTLEKLLVASIVLLLVVLGGLFLQNLLTPKESENSTARATLMAEIEMTAIARLTPTATLSAVQERATRRAIPTLTAAAIRTARAAAQTRVAISTATAASQKTATAATEMQARVQARQAVRNIAPASNEQEAIARGENATVAILELPSGRIIGSGAIISPDGLILTNYHVVAWDTEFGVGRMVSKSEARWMYNAELVKTHPTRDIAVLRITTDSKGQPFQAFEYRLPSLRLGDSDALWTGETIYIFGYPGTGGQTVTLTQGLVSGFESIDGYEYVKTDAEISPGNSGGAAVNSQGYLVGIPTYIRTAWGGRGKLGYLIPINEARNIIPADLRR